MGQDSAPGRQQSPSGPSPLASPHRAGGPRASEGDTRGAAFALLRRFEPILRLTRGELFLPGSVEPYLADAALVSGGDGSGQVLAEPGTLNARSLARLGRQHGHEPLSLRYVQRPLTRAEYRQWRHSGAPPAFERSSGFAAAGLLARVVATMMRLSLILRGRVPGGHTAAAVLQSRSAGAAADECHYYGHVQYDAGYLTLQYWFFYPMNDWRSSFSGVNDHEADWEQVVVFLVDDDGDWRPAWVAFASHDEKGGDLRRRWDDPELEHVGDHPVVYVGAGSHSAACLPGEYLVTVAPDLPKWVERVRAKVARILPWWDPSSVGIGIPFIDYRRGDGLHIGPGQHREWHAHMIDDDTDWVHDYRGLWGLDTGDPLGGERAPAGPRYERSGAVRQSWSQPVAWAGLDAEPPTRDEAIRLWLEQPDRLKCEIGSVEEALDNARDELRVAELATRRPASPSLRPLGERDALQAQVTTLRTRQDQLRSALDAWSGSPEPPGQAGVHDHLRHRAVPMALDRQARSRALRAWTSASSTLLLAALGLLLLSGRSELLRPAAAIVVLMLLVEAALRRHLVGLVVNLVAAAGVVAGTWFLARLLLGNVRAGVGVLLLLAAAYMGAQTLADALVHRTPRRHRPEEE